MADALVISGLDCFYEDTQILHGLALSLREGEVHCLLGRNGAGKTTALKCIMGLVPARAGSIGRRLRSRRIAEAPALPPRSRAETSEAWFSWTAMIRRLRLRRMRLPHLVQPIRNAASRLR